MVNHFISCADDLVTTHEQTRAGFLSIALEKNRFTDPFVRQALTFKAMVAQTSTPTDFLEMVDVRPFLLTAAGLSNKSMKYLTESDQISAIRDLITKFLEPSGENYIDETIFRFLLIKGDAVGGMMRNYIGALGQEKFVRALLSCLNVRGMEYRWMSNIGNGIWSEQTEDDHGIEKDLKALYWENKKKQKRILAFNITIPTVKKNVDICLFKCKDVDFDLGKIVSEPKNTIMLGELKAGIDPAGADEHWKTANTALTRIRSGFSSIGMKKLKTSFVGAAIASAMSKEIYKQLEEKVLTNAANLNNIEQLTDFCNWVLSL